MDLDGHDNEFDVRIVECFSSVEYARDGAGDDIGIK